MGQFDIPVEDRDVYSYLNEARAMILKWGYPAMANDEDIVTNVASAIAKAEYDFDPSRGVKRSTFRITYGQRLVWAEAKKLKTRSKRPTHFSLNQESSDKSYTGSSGSNKNHIEVEDYREPITEAIETKQQKERIKKKVDKVLKSKVLTPKQRKYLRMHYLRGHSVSDLAERNGCSKQAVSEIIRTGVTKLQKELIV